MLGQTFNDWYFNDRPQVRGDDIANGVARREDKLLWKRQI